MKTLIKIIKVIAWSKVIYGGSQLLLGKIEWSLLVIWGVFILTSSSKFLDNKKIVKSFLIVSIIALVSGFFIRGVLGVNLFIFGLLDLIFLLNLKGKMKNKL